MTWLSEKLVSIIFLMILVPMNFTGYLGTKNHQIWYETKFFWLECTGICKFRWWFNRETVYLSSTLQHKDWRLNQEPKFLLLQYKYFFCGSNNIQCSKFYQLYDFKHFSSVVPVISMDEFEPLEKEKGLSRVTCSWKGTLSASTFVWPKIPANNTEGYKKLEAWRGNNYLFPVFTYCLIFCRRYCGTRF